MNFARKLTLAIASVVLIFGLVLAQEEESPVLLSLNPVTAEKLEEETVKEPAAPVFVEPRPLQVIRQIGSSAGGSRPGIGDTLRNLNITGRLSNFRRRLGRFHVPRLETNEQSLAYRSGRRIGLILQSISKRARAFAERLRVRAGTATPTIQ